MVSASWGYALGRQALTGVRQPDSRPASSAATNRAAPSGQAATLRSEQDIVNEVQARMSGGAVAPDSELPRN
ncbi:MAG: hypothetical protein O3A14_07475 [Cyanobacteria bacterium]|nr:hypothetical protein [Cyanobacteriota bacterium]